MARFENFVENALQGLTMTLGIAGAAPYTLQTFGLEVTLMALIIILGALNVYLIYALKSDVANRFGNLEGDLTSRFDDLEDTLQRDSKELRTDGSGWEEVPQLSAEKVEMTGIPSTAGAALGGALGALFSPAGAAAGALFGAAIAGGKEYADLKEQHQQQLRRIAKETVQLKTIYQGWEIGIDDVTDVNDGFEEFWEFSIRDRRAEIHKVRINKENGSVTYKSPSAA
ncbi:hypothetical protein [Halosimplex halobium]|uniref:hypothetical protein n=1 Tax=Halosimplex halobium TaxID=3396618 RepID=UPI003F57466B